MDQDMSLSWGRRVPGDVIEKWPRDAAGEPVPAALLAGGSEMNMDDAIIMSMLESYGIPSFKQYPHYGGFGKTIMGVSAEGTDIYVPETMLEDAKALMEGEPDDEEL